MRISPALAFAAISAPLWAAMPPAEQNALVKQYCAVCHTDAARNGGLSLQHYDAAKPDPPLAAMLLSKLNNGAMGAAGIGVPGKPSQQAWRASTKEQAAGAGHWFVSRQNGALSASIIRDVPPRDPNVSDNPLYRLTLACNASSGAGEIQLTWSPQPETGSTMTASADGAAPVAYRIEGKELMGNGATVQSGHASVFLSDGGRLAFPASSLTIRDLFPGEAVEFPLSALDPKTRTELSACFIPR